MYILYVNVKFLSMYKLRFTMVLNNKTSLALLEIKHFVGIHLLFLVISTSTVSEKKLHILNKHCENIMDCRRKFVYIHTYIHMYLHTTFMKY